MCCGRGDFADFVVDDAGDWRIESSMCSSRGDFADDDMMEEPDLQDDHHLGSYAMVGNDLTEPRMALRQQPQPEEPQEDPDYIIVNREIQETPPAPPELQEIQESAVGEITTSLESLAIAARAVRVLNLGPQWGQHAISKYSESPPGSFPTASTFGNRCAACFMTTGR